MKYVLKNGMFKRNRFKSLINIYIKLKLLPRRWTFYQIRKINVVLIVKKYL